MIGAADHVTLDADAGVPVDLANLSAEERALFEDAWPAGRPKPASSNGLASPAPGHALPTLSLDSVAPIEVAWLWGGRVPYGKLTLQEGDPDKGKSTVLLDLAARVTSGRCLPYDGHSSRPGDVLLFMAEDGLDDTVVPRLIAAGADMSRVHVVTSGDVGLPSGVPALEATVRDLNAQLLVFDPMTAYFDENVKIISDTSVRRALRPLTDMAQRTGVALVANRHLNKDSTSGAKAMQRGTGSMALIAAARSAWHVGKLPDDDEVVYLATFKHNLTRRPPALKYRIVAPSGVPVIQWEGESTVTADQLVGAANAEPDTKLEETVERIRDLLSEGAQPAVFMERRAADWGVSATTLKRAKKTIGVVSSKQGAVGGWMWSLPDPSGPGGSRARTGADDPLQLDL